MLLLYFILVSHIGRVAATPPGAVALFFLLFIFVRTGFYSSVHHISFSDLTSSFYTLPGALGFTVASFPPVVHLLSFFFVKQHSPASPPVGKGYGGGVGYFTRGPVYLYSIDRLGV